MCRKFKKQVLSVFILFVIPCLAVSATILEDIDISQTNEKEAVAFTFSEAIEPTVDEGPTVLEITFPDTSYPGETGMFFGDHLADRVIVYTPEEDTVKAEIIMGHEQFQYEKAWENNTFIITLIPKEEKVPVEEPDISAELEQKLLNNRITLDIKEASIVNILRLISNKTDVNIIAGPEVEGKVTVRFQNVPLKSALDSILKAQGFGYVEEDGILRVTTIERLGIEEVETQTRIYHLNWTFAREVQQSIEPLLTSDVGKISINASTNNLIITDTPHRLQELEQFIDTIDKRTRQVVIEARMANVDKEYSRDIGIDWYLAKTRSGHDIFDDVIDDAGFDYYQRAVKGIASPFGSPGDARRLVSMGTTISGYDLHATLDALEREGHVETLESPRIIVTDNKEATFEVIGELPYTEAKIESGGISQDVRFKDVGVKMYVTPHITDTDHIMMDIETEQIIKVDEHPVQTAGDRGTVTNYVPIVDRRSTTTNLIVKNNTPFVIGGFRSMKQGKTQTGVPWLRSIPVLGALFRSQRDSTQEVELMVFVTPSIYEEDPEEPLQWDERIYYEKFDHY